MPPKPGTQSSPHMWLQRARSNLARARQEKPGETFWEDLCFDAQQAAEKALKALILHRNGKFAYTHDLDVLFSELAKTDLKSPEFAKQATLVLTQYAGAARYPGTFEPAMESDYREALQLAEAVVAWVESHI